MLKYWLAANFVQNVGPVKLKKYLQGLGSIEKVCEALSAPIDLAEKEIKKAEDKGIKILCFDDLEYPAVLKQIYDPPSIIYVRGKIPNNIGNSIAMVGTRKATTYGLEITKKIAGELSALGINIISGLAMGIDTAAHRGALIANGQTSAVLGSGVDLIYPPSNQKLADEILKSGGALISEYPIGFPPDKWTFPQRNRIISGLSLGVIVVEGHYESGAMITAKIALEQGREVFAVPGNIGLEQTKGPHWLIKQGAKLIESIDDVLEELQHVININKEKAEPVALKDYSGLSEDEMKIINCLSAELLHIDDLSINSQLPISKLSSLLMMLEFKHYIKQFPGKMFTLY
ncbi:MAG: DNA processing protein [Candidatus Saganbacteria bacterium]|uniref:DNA processing protein n=1 Tax=Candidatus Saganbacteria bacterium TaxID=2575572 RepID=A0A833P2V7_UNCSA|nr:MAG: DNA processing protein [Candidatus Saganbacteria bacterium]